MIRTPWPLNLGISRVKVSLESGTLQKCNYLCPCDVSNVFWNVNRLSSFLSLAGVRSFGGAHAHTTSSRPSTTFPRVCSLSNFQLINARPVVVRLNIGVFFSPDFTKSHFVTVKLLWNSVSIDFSLVLYCLGARAAPWQQLTHFVNSISALKKTATRSQ